jgi:hypothetical protein
MLLMVIGMAFTPDAVACSPDVADVLATAPADGAVDVPLDAMVVLQVGSGFVAMGGDPEFQVWVDDEPSAGTQTGWTRTASPTAETGQLIFSPDSPFPSGASVRVSVSNIGWGSGPFTLSFSTGDAGTSPVAGVPMVNDVLVHHESVDTPSSSCDSEEWRTVDLSTSPASGTVDPLSWLLVYRVSDGVAEDVPFDVLGPLVDDSPLRLATVMHDDIDRALTEECYTVAQVDAAGGRVWADEIVCSVDTTEAGDSGDPEEDGGSVSGDRDPSDGGSSDTPSDGSGKGCAVVARPLGLLWCLPLGGILLGRRRRVR